MPTNIKNVTNVTDEDANAMGYELVLAISANNYTECVTLIEKGANVNFCHEITGNTPLHFLYFYANCIVEYLELLLENGAKITANRAGLLPIELAEKNCNATALQTIKEVFDRYILAPFNITQSKPNETRLIPYHQQKFTMTIGIPIAALLSGVFVGVYEEVAQRNKEQYPYLPNLIFYGLQPISLAIGSAAMNFLLVGNTASVGIEDAWLSFAFYLGINYFGLMFAQLGEKLTKKIQNKVLNLLIPILLYTFYLNSSLTINLLSDGFGMQSFQAVMMPLLATLSSGILFQAGKLTTQKVSKSVFFKNTSLSGKNITQYELDSSLNVNSENIYLLNSFETCFSDLKINFQQIKSKDYYKIFEKDLNSFPELSEDIVNLDQSDFNDFSKKFEKIIKDLEALEPNKNKKINKLLIMTRKTNAALNNLRPCAPLNSNEFANSTFSTFFSTAEDKVLPPPPDADNCLELGIPFRAN